MPEKSERRIDTLFEVVLFALIFAFSLHGIVNYDFWFHILGGKLILETKTLPTIDTLSHSAFGTPLVPYEWLAQVILYALYTFAGPTSVQLLVAFLATSFIFIFRRILVDIFHLSFLPRLILSGSLYLLTFDFWVERPQSFAYVFFILSIYLILRTNQKFTKIIWLITPLLWIWTNLHASMVLTLFLLGGISLSRMLSYFLRHYHLDLQQAKMLVAVGVLGLTVTLLPPLGIRVYQLLWLFFEKKDFISRVIDEWLPLTIYPTQLLIYSTLTLTAIFLSIIWFARSRVRWQILPWIPFIPIVFLPFTGIRHIPFGGTALFLLAAFVLSSLDTNITYRAKKLKTTIAVIFLIFFGILAYHSGKELQNLTRDYPTQAIEFMRLNLKGNMFNEYTVGGYLLYQLYPDHKVFIDGRTDMYLPKVLPEYIGISDRKLASEEEFLAYWNKLVSSYQISYALLPTRNLTVWKRLGRLLSTHDEWRLIYWDDIAWIFVRLDGKNDDQIDKFGTLAATPYSKSLYKSGSRNQAKVEYARMNGVAASGVSTNALGYISLEESNYSEAKKLFELAQVRNPDFASPYMNLGELAAKDKKWDQAIELYKQAIAKEPDRGLAYLRLGQLSLEAGDSTSEAIKYWRLGLERSSDEEIRQKLQEQLGKHAN